MNGRYNLEKRRQEAILEIIEKYDLSTQDELLQKLKDSGFDATQATVSRDIKELRLVKTMGANGQYKYAVTKTESDELLSKFRSIFAQSVVSADYAGNTIVIRCYTGMAQAACAAFDSMHWEGLVGTLAGDDTIFALCRSESYASQMKDSIKRLIGKMRFELCILSLKIENIAIIESADIEFDSGLNVLSGRNRRGQVDHNRFYKRRAR